MSKYYKFIYDAGYVGTETTEIFKFPDNASDKYVEECFDEWYEEQRTDCGRFEEISEEEAEGEGIDEDLED